MTDTPTGPSHFSASLEELRAAFENNEPNDDFYTARAVALLSSLVSAVHAQTAMMAMHIDAVTKGHPPYEMDAWREVIPLPPLKECRGKENRRPECTERHTDDCKYADPPPEPKHVLLDVGTRVLVTEKGRDQEGWLRYRNPVAGRISGYDMSRSKYQWQEEFDTGMYYTFNRWTGVGNHVEVHPDGPECPPPPQPVKREPTGPRMYVENHHGKQGHVLEVLHIEKDDSLWYRVQFLAPGVEPVLKRADSLTVIAPSQVHRCPRGQTGDECGSGENQCEPCLADEDGEADAIEGSMRGA